MRTGDYGMKLRLAAALAGLVAGTLATSAMAEPVVAKLQAPTQGAAKPVAGGAVFECTTKQIRVRRAEENVCCCTNHFRIKGLATSRECSRYGKLEKSRTQPRLDVAEVAKHLDAVNQREYTLHTIVFEPAALKLHLAFGEGPSSRLPLKALDLAPLLRRQDGE